MRNLFKNLCSGQWPVIRGQYEPGGAAKPATSHWQLATLFRRRGSVLIFVVVLVVLLALLGTALLSTTSGDRYVASQNSANTQVDMMIDGLKQIIAATLQKDLTGVDSSLPNLAFFRPPINAASDAATFGNWDWHYVPIVGGSQQAPQLLNGTVSNDSWLAARIPVPTLAMPQSTQDPGTVLGVAWPAITVLPGVTDFFSPFVVVKSPSGQDTVVAGPTSYKVAAQNSGPNHVNLTPTSAWDGVATNPLPAWESNIPGPGGNEIFVAGDADGDGIADSGLFRLAEIDGVTYYGAVRIVDNCAAVNVNTALSSSSDFALPVTSGGAAPATPVDTLGDSGDLVSTTLAPTQVAGNLGVFRSHIGLRELMDVGPVVGPQVLDAQITAIRDYRLGLGSAPNVQVLGGAYQDDATPVSNFNFSTVGELLEDQLARRVDNPGIIGLNGGASFSGGTFSSADANALAYHFTLNNTLSSPSPLETAMKNFGTFDTIYSLTPNLASAAFGTINFPRRGTSYSADQVGAWFNDNFNFDGLTGTVGTTREGVHTAVGPLSFTTKQAARPIRALLTTHNPISMQIPARYADVLTNPKALPLMPPSPVATPVPPATVVEMTPYRAANPTAPALTGTPAKACVNTASFNELWRAYWCVMAELDKNSTGTFSTPFGDDRQPPNSPNPIPLTNTASIAYQGMHFDGANNPIYDPQNPTYNFDPQRMFRSSMRDWRATGGYYFTPQDQLLLRAGIAAEQTMNMRADPDTVNGNGLPARTLSSPIRNITLPMAGGPNVSVNIFGAQPQLFITEVVIAMDPAISSEPYILIELYNPYSVDVKVDQSWHIIGRTRSGTFAPGTNPLDNSKNLFHQDFLPGPPVGPHQFMLIDNFNPAKTGPSDSRRGVGPKRPAAVTSKLPETGLLDNLTTSMAPSPTGYVSIPELADRCLDLEMVIVRDPNAGQAGSSTMPLDSYDFTGFSSGWWHYQRFVGNPTSGGDSAAWQCVYPGRYDGTQGGTPTAGPRQQGTEIGAQVTTPLADFMPADFKLRHFYPTVLPIQLPDKGAPGPNDPRDLSATGKFPYGGFMRDGDILQVPFIGAYTITSGTQIIEMNSITMDASFAEDSDTQDDYPLQAGKPNLPTFMDQPMPREQIGRFCPLQIFDPTGVPQAGWVDDFNDDPTAISSLHRYAWARDLFDYLTVQSPAVDYMPALPSPQLDNSNPKPVHNSSAGAAGLEDNPNIAGYNTTPSGSNPVVGAEDAQPIQGRININTADWKVLSTIPWVPKGTDGFSFEFDPNLGKWLFNQHPNGRDDNEDIAKAIVTWRDGTQIQGQTPAPNGPFKSIFDLYRVKLSAASANNPIAEPTLLQAVQTYLANTYGVNGEPDDSLGDFTPFNGSVPPPQPQTDGARNDFEEEYLIMTRVSNLITTRSDSFTVYIVVQGWRGKELVVQRRAAYIQDRWQLSPDSRKLNAAIELKND